MRELKTYRFWYLLFNVTLPLTMSTAAIGQEAAVELEPVIVSEPYPPPGLNLDAPSETGSRLGIPVQETPASVEIVDRPLIELRTNRTAAEVAEGSTGLIYGNPPGDPSVFSFRGFTENQITQLYDGIRVGPATMTSRPFDSFNLERVEVLKGPSSMLYGEGAVGGAVNFVTKRPARGKREIEALVGYGSFDSLRLGIGSGGPIGNTLHYRVDLSRNTSDTFIDRADFEYLNFTSGVLWDINDRVSLQVSFDASRDRISPYWGTPLVTPAFGAKPISGIVDADDGRVIDERLRDKNYNVGDNTMESDIYWGRGKLNWKLSDSWELRNELYYFNAERVWRNSETYTFNAATGLIDRDRFFVAHDQQIIGNRLEVKSDGPWFGHDNRFIVGTDANDLDFFRPSFFAGGDSVDPFNPVPGNFGPITPAVRTAKIRTYALFAEDQFKITPKLQIAAGLRAESVRLERKNFRADGSERPDGLERKFDPITGRLGLIYEPKPGLNIYGQISTAADLPGGGNILLAGAGDDFDLTKGLQYEVGLKQRFWRDKGEWTLAWFDITRKNILTRTGFTPAGDEILQNIGKQSSDGLELALNWQLNPSWRIAGNYAYTRARFDEFNDFDGKTPPNVAKHVANFESSYRFARGVPIELGSSIRYVGERNANHANTIRLKGYTTVDAYAAWLSKYGRLTLRGRNLTDKDYVTWVDTFYPDQVLLGSPRSAELVFSAKF